MSAMAASARAPTPSTHSSVWRALPMSVFGHRELLLALFLIAGLIKQEPWLAWLPVDLTLLGALLTALLVIAEFVHNGQVIPRAVFMVASVFLAFLPGLTWTEWTPYAVEKAKYFFTLTLLATVAPIFLITTPLQVRRFLHALTFFGLIIAINAMYLFIADPTRYERLGADTPVSTISTGLMAGLAIIWTVTLLVASQLNLVVASGFLVVLTGVLVGVGSRGPVVTLAFPLILVAILSCRRMAWLRLGPLIVAAVMGLQLGLTLAPALSTSRLEAFFAGELNDSVQTRADYVQLAWNTVQEQPLGLGLGGFGFRIVPWSNGPGPYAREFPHNILVEIVLEGGWAAGLLFTALVCGALWKMVRITLRAQHRVEAIGLLSVLVFLLSNDLISGELNDSRLLWAILGLALSLSNATHLAPEADDERIS